MFLQELYPGQRVVLLMEVLMMLVKIRLLGMKF